MTLKVRDLEDIERLANEGDYARAAEAGCSLAKWLLTEVLDLLSPRLEHEDAVELRQVRLWTRGRVPRVDLKQLAAFAEEGRLFEACFRAKGVGFTGLDASDLARLAVIDSALLQRAAGPNDVEAVIGILRSLTTAFGTALQEARPQGAKGFAYVFGVCPRCDHAASYPAHYNAIECDGCEHDFRVGRDGDPVGVETACPLCGGAFYVEEFISPVTCWHCGDGIYVGDNGEPVCLDLVCPICGGLDYGYDAGKVNACVECGQEFQVGRDSKPIGCLNECPHCTEEVYTEADYEPEECPHCGEEFVGKQPWSIDPASLGVE